MRQQRPTFTHFQEIAIGILAMALRLAVLFTVMGAGYAVYTQFGLKWFYVFIFATIAVRLHLEIAWIEQHFANKDCGDKRPPENPFRKR